MPFTHRGRFRRGPSCVARLAASGLPLLLAACGGAEGAEGAGVWFFASLAMVLVGAAAFVLGSLVERRRGEQALRAARAELRSGRQLDRGWSWQTDEQHRLVSWRGPGAAGVAECPLFVAAGGEELRARLAHEQPFAAQRVAAGTAFEGSVGWELGGVPSYDDLGRFTGFVGGARPTDAEDAIDGDARALAPVLQSFTPAVVVAMNRGQGWHVTHFNDAARQLWPTIAEGARLDDLASSLPPTVRQACAQAGHGGRLDVQGWRLVGFGPLADGASGRVLAQLAGADGSDPQESENFSFTVSHDLRAPIRVVEGFTRILKEDYGRQLDRVGNDHLDRVLSAATRMNLMIDALLTLARLSSQPLARQPVNLSQLAGFVIEDLRRAAPEREVEVVIEPGLTAVGDPTLLRLVLENLLGNAWKYTARTSTPRISLCSVAHGTRRAFEVRDNGAGFDMRTADRLFGLFQRLHSASEFPGHGVGLASVRRIVRRHSGELWAESEPGRGAAFFFTLGD